VRPPEFPEPDAPEKESLEEDHPLMAGDTEHERDAHEWCEGLIGDLAELD
jgi:hypothetical protein